MSSLRWIAHSFDLPFAADKRNLRQIPVSDDGGGGKGSTDFLNPLLLILS